MAPKLNWDMLAYSGIVMSWFGVPDPHASAYADAEAFAQARGLLAVFKESSLNAGFQTDMAKDAAAFTEQLPFYTIRPLYLFIILLIAKLTGTVSGAGLALSVLSTLACILLVLAYAVHKLGAALGGMAGALFAIAPTTLTVVRFSSPDALVMLMVCAAYVLIVREQVVAGALVLLAGTLVRSDLALWNLTLAIALLASAGRDSRCWRMRLPAAGVLLLSLPVIKAVEAWVGNYGYVVHWHYTFDGFTRHPIELAGVPIDPSAYLRQILIGVRENIGNGGLWTVLLLSGIVVALQVRAHVHALSPIAAAMASVLLYLPARMILYPSHELRLMAPLIAGLTILVIAAAAVVSPLGAQPLDPRRRGQIAHPY